MTIKHNLIVINDGSLARGGATALAIESALGAAQAGWNVTFFTRKQAAPDPRLMANGIVLREVEGQKVSGRSPAKAFISGIWNNTAKSELHKLISEHDMSQTIIHVHNWAHFLSPSIFEPLRPHQDRVIMSTHDFFLTCGNGGQFNYQTRTPCPLVGNSPKCLATRCDKRNSIQKMWRVARHRTRQRTLPSAKFDGTVALVHNKQRPFFEQAGFAKENILEIRNPISALTHTRVMAEENDSILFIGRLDVEKGADIAAEAAELAGARIVFAGEGPLKETIRQTYTTAEIMGFCDREKLTELIKKARLLIMPSWLETFGLAAVESLWSGVPVLMSQNALLSDDIVKRDAGVQIDPTDPSAISEVIKAMMQDDAQVRRLSENAFHRSSDIANTPASWNSNHLDIYEKVLSNRMETPETIAQKVALLNVHFSANLGDGLLSDCLAYGLENSRSNIEAFPVDLAGRDSITTLGGSNRGTALKVLAQLPAPLRRMVIAPLQNYYLKTLWMPHYDRLLSNANHVVLGGGNLIVDQDLNFPVKIHAALSSAAAKNLPVHIYGVGVGSKFSQKALQLFRAAFSQCDLKSVTVRDEKSRINWEKYFAPYCEVRADVVYDPGIAAAHCWPVPKSPSSFKHPIDCAIGIMSPNELNYHNYGGKFKRLDTWYLDLIRALQREGRNIVLFSNGSPEDTNYIKTHLIPKLTDVDVFIPEDQSELSALLANANLTLAFRLHAIIPATSYGKHVVALEWDKKIRSFMDRIGKSEQCLNMRTTAARDAAKICMDLLSNPSTSEDFSDIAKQEMAGLAKNITQ